VIICRILSTAPPVRPSGGGQPEASPFDRRVALRVFPVEHVAILDKQQRIHDEARNVGEVGKDPFGKTRAINLLAVAVGDAQPSLILFAIDREQLVVGRRDEIGRPLHLALHLEPVSGQRLDKAGQTGIAEPLVIGAALRKPDRLARSLRDPEGQAARPA
jgi:hypothetical protein